MANLSVAKDVIAFLHDKTIKMQQAVSKKPGYNLS
jgi:hypothetical protein